VNLETGRSFTKAEKISRVDVIIRRPGSWVRGALHALALVSVAVVGVAGGIWLQHKGFGLGCPSPRTPSRC